MSDGTFDTRVKGGAWRMERRRPEPVSHGGLGCPEAWACMCEIQGGGACAGTWPDASKLGVYNRRPLVYDPGP
jgi:hypothetical protein